MLFKDSGVYLEAWELQTVGYWSVNQPEVVSYCSNIGTGDPRFTSSSEELSMLGIATGSLVGEDAQNALPLTGYSIPAGWVLWFALFMALCFFAVGEGYFTLALIPLLGLVASLLVASPIWYWPRYVAALQFALPCLVAMLVLVCGHRAVDQPDGLKH